MSSAPIPSLHAFFGRDGLLAKAHPAFEFRRSQLEMAQAVAGALAERHHLLVEAGTGTGKTLAYLLPALQSGRRVLISTGTRNLQEQLIGKDIPLLAEALGVKLKAIAMKGRQNYACRQKIADLSVQPTLLAADELPGLQQIGSWVETSESGDQAELAFLPENSPLWQRVNARRETCTGQKCPRFDSCFLTALHRRASEADLVIVNHHLFFADLVLKRQELPGVLPPYEAVIFDEAHELESIASQYFGVAVSSHQVEELVRDATEALRLKNLGSPALDSRLDRLRRAGLEFFGNVAEADGRQPLPAGAQVRERHRAVYDHFLDATAAVVSGLENLAERPEEIRALARRGGELQTRLRYLMESDDPAVVMWTERRGRHAWLQATPIEVSAILREVLFQATDSIVLTSATLAVDRSFAYLRARLGVDHARERIVASPFAFHSQALLYLPEHLPEPRDPDFTAGAAAEIEAILECSSGRAFVLCTSYEQMRQFHRLLNGRLKFPLLLQGQRPRNLLLEEFRATPHAVLFATSSFWQGVDVQGEQLSCVIVDKLPFAAPTDPVVAARVRALEAAGGHPFLDFQVPEAVLALKQGLGRLIRSRRDSGVVAVLDSRILRKSYGRHFLRSLPDFAFTSRLAEVRRFFETGRLPPATVQSVAGWPDEGGDLMPDGAVAANAAFPLD